MAKHLIFKSLSAILMLVLFSCDNLREIEQIDCAETTIDFILDQSLSRYSGTMVFKGTNDSEAPLVSAGFFLLPRETGGTLNIKDVKSVSGEIDWEVEEAVLTVDFDVPVAPQRDYEIEIDFEGTVPSTLELPGIFFRTDDTVALGHFYPLPIPLNGEGSFTPVYPSHRGDPVESILSSFDVTFKAPARLRFAASGLVDRGKKEGSLINCSVSTGPVRDFYLLGSANWDMVTKVSDGIRITSWYPEGRMQQGIDSIYAIEESLKIFEEYFGPYPYNSMNIVSGPLGSRAGGMEYPGIIVLNDDYYTEEDTFALRWVIAHEIGHQWFYNLVGNDPVMEPWIDESFTQYATWLYFDKVHGTRSGNWVFQSFDNRWTRVGKEHIALNLSAHEYAGRQYGAIPYGKGPLFLFTLRTKFGEELFDQFVREYQQKYRWERMTTEKLRDFMFEYFGNEGDLLFRQWVYGEDVSPSEG